MDMETKVTTIQDSWAKMFHHIDDLINKITSEYPSFSSGVNRDIIQDAVRKAQQVDRILEQAVKLSKDNANQEEMFNDNN
jgi:hypothetical protein